MNGGHLCIFVLLMLKLMQTQKYIMVEMYEDHSGDFQC